MVRKLHYMSATVVRAKRQTTLPEDVCEAAGISLVRPVKFKGLLIAPQNLKIDMQQLDEDLRRMREESDERLLG